MENNEYLLLSQAEVQKGDKKYYIINLFNPDQRRAVVTKFVSEQVYKGIPLQKVVTSKDIEDLETVKIESDLSGNILSIE